MKIKTQLKRALTIAKKNLRIYYAKGPVIIFGLMVPFFFFLSFMIGRDLSGAALGTGLIGMTLWFTATAISPVITPWETNTKTLERLVASPVSIAGILVGDLLSSASVGLALTLVPLLITTVIIDLSVMFPVLLIGGIIIASFCFSTIGLLLASLPTATPADVMMLASFIKFPIIFVSGIFLPVAALPEGVQIVSYFSPLTYLTDLSRFCFGGQGRPFIDVVVLTGYFLGTLLLAIHLHKHTMPKRLP